MTIYRTMNGGERGLVLTSDELRSAYYEYQKQCDLANVTDYFNSNYVDYAENSFSENEIERLRALLPEIAEEYRRIEDSDRSSDWWDSACRAIETIRRIHAVAQA